MTKNTATELEIKVLKASNLLTEAINILLQQDDFITNDELFKLWETTSNINHKVFNLHKKYNKISNKL